MSKKYAVGEKPETYEASPEVPAETFKQSETPAEQLYVIVFKQNRSIGITVNGEYLTFNCGKEYTVPESVINSPDFKSQAKNFSIKKQGGN